MFCIVYAFYVKMLSYICICSKILNKCFQQSYNTFRLKFFFLFPYTLYIILMTKVSDLMFVV